MNMLKNKVIRTLLASTVGLFSYIGIASPALPYIPVSTSTDIRDKVTVLDYIGYTVGYGELRGGPLWAACLTDNKKTPAVYLEGISSRYLNVCEDPNFKGAYNVVDFKNSRVSCLYRDNYMAGGVGWHEGVTSMHRSAGMEDIRPTEDNKPLSVSGYSGWAVSSMIPLETLQAHYGIEAAKEGYYITNVSPTKDWSLHSFTSYGWHCGGLSVKVNVPRYPEGSDIPRKCLNLVLTVPNHPESLTSEEGIFCPGVLIYIYYYFDAPNGGSNYLKVYYRGNIAGLNPSLKSWKEGQSPAKEGRYTAVEFLAYIEELLSLDLSAAIPIADRENTKL